MDMSTLYWILILPNIKTVFILLAVIFSLTIVITVMYGFLEDEPEARGWGIGKIKIFIPIVLMAALIPSERQIFYMIGGYAATNVENIEKLPKNVVNAANKFLESYTDKEKK